MKQEKERVWETFESRLVEVWGRRMVIGDKVGCVWSASGWAEDSMVIGGSTQVGDDDRFASQFGLGPTTLLGVCRGLGKKAQGGRAELDSVSSTWIVGDVCTGCIEGFSEA